MSDDKDGIKTRIINTFGDVPVSKSMKIVDDFVNTFGSASAGKSMRTMNDFVNAFGVDRLRTEKEQALFKLQKLSPFIEKKGGLSQLEQAKQNLYPLELDTGIEGIEYNIEFESLDIQERATPIMTIYELFVMLPPPIFSHYHRNELANGIFYAIERWGMPVVGYPDSLEYPEFFGRLSYHEKIYTRIHIETFREFAIAGKIMDSAVKYAELWQGFIVDHEKRIRFNKIKNSNKTKKVLSAEQQEKLERCINRAEYIAKNFEKYKRRNEKGSVLAVFKHVMEKEKVSKSWLYEFYPLEKKKKLSKLLINK